jgi:hypothetical protein
MVVEKSAESKAESRNGSVPEKARLHVASEGFHNTVPSILSLHLESVDLLLIDMPIN